MSLCVACQREFSTTHLKNGRAHKCCPACRQEAKDRRTLMRQADPDAMARYQRDLRRRYREEALATYGGICACCGEARYEFLSLDHVNGGGTRERKELALWGASFTRWLARQGYPQGFRVLCHNCNSAYGYYGYCPHQQAVEIA